MNEMIERQLVALELKTPYSPVIHHREAIGNLLYLDGHFCSSEWKKEMESALIILLEMKQGVN